MQQRLGELTGVAPLAAGETPWQAWTLSRRTLLNPGSQGEPTYLLGLTPPAGCAWQAGDILEGMEKKLLRALIKESALPLGDDLPPMSAGLFGYLGYDMVRQMEHLPTQKPDHLGVPDAILIRPTVVVIFDAVRDEVTVVTPPAAFTLIVAGLFTSSSEPSAGVTPLSTGFTLVLSSSIT